MRRFISMAMSVSLIAGLGGCTRQYVAKPDAARDYNSIDWTIESVPQMPSREEAATHIDGFDRAEVDSGSATVKRAVDESEEEQ